MDCREVQERLSAWLDGELPDALGRSLAAHLEVCPQCRAEWQALQRLEDILADLLAPTPPDMTARVLARLQRRRAAPWWKSLALAASLILGVFLGNVLTGQLYPMSPRGSSDEIMTVEVLQDFPQGSWGAMFTSQPAEEGNGA